MNLDLKLALALVTAHLLADFVLQSDKDVQNKKKPMVLGKHALIVAALSYLLAGNWQAWHVPALIGLTHFLIDRVKAALKQNGLGVFLLDQAAHLLVIAGVVWLSSRQFPENRAEAEYITIGTLMSFTWGLVAAWATWQVFSLL